MKRFIIYIFLTLSAFSTLAAQQTLSLKECLRIGIESNYGVKIAANNLSIAENNVIKDPFLPTVGASARQNHDNVSVLSHSREITIADLRNTYAVNALNAELGLSWTLFDGMKMFATYDTRKELLKLGELALRNSMEQLVSDISIQYYYIITQQGNLNAAKKYLEISTLRYNQAREKYILKTISGLELNQAKLDFNADSSRLVTQQELLDNAYIQIFELMNIDLRSPYEISDTIILNETFGLQPLIDNAMERNTSILMQRRGIKISELDLKIARSNRYPTLAFGSAYRSNYNSISTSDLLYARTNTLNWGFTLSATLFNGGDVNRRVKNARIGIENSELLTKDAELSVTSAISQLYNTYRNNFLMIGFENETSAAALQNLEAAVVMNRIGKMSGVEFREIQRSFLEAESRKLSAIFQAKVSEISLKYLSGEILD